jgi:hypothetical protein
MMLRGRNKATSKKEVIDIDDDGKIKIDESLGITNILNKITDIYNHTYNSDLRTIRRQGNCYVVSYNYVGTSETLNTISIWNPVGSGKYIYIYNIGVHFDTDLGNDYASRTIVYKTSSEPTGGTSATPDNMCVGSSNTSNITARINFTQVGSATVMMHLTAADEPGSINPTNFEFKEYIEILPGNGIYIRAFAGTGSSLMRYVSHIRYAETDAQIP